MAQDELEYANWWSRVFFHDAFDRGFFVPIPPPAAVRVSLEAIERVCFPPRKLADLQVEKPVFVVGLPRSGTTMLFNLLCAHEHAAYVTNCMNVYPNAMLAIDCLRKTLKLNVRGERFLKDSVYLDFGGPSELVTLWGKWTGRGIEETDWESVPVQVTPAMKALAHEDFKRVLYGFPGARRVISKNPVFQTELLTLQELFPDARFINIVRDGRMTANSLVKLYNLNNQHLERIKHPLIRTVVPYPRTRSLPGYIAQYGAGSLECASLAWNDGLQLVRRVAPQLNHYTEVRYEDLLASPEAETRRLFEFCELDWPSADNAEFQRQFAGVGVIHHERNYGNFEVVERLAHQTLADYGYAGAMAGS